MEHILQPDPNRFVGLKRPLMSVPAACACAAISLRSALPRTAACTAVAALCSSGVPVISAEILPLSRSDLLKKNPRGLCITLETALTPIPKKLPQYALIYHVF